MRRRLKVSLVVALGIVGGTALLAAIGVLVLLRTDWGNALVRDRIVAMAEGALGPRGSLLVGRLDLSPLGTAAIDTLELRDSTGALVFASGPLRAEYAVGPLLDRELRLLRFVIARPQAHLAQDTAGRWNIATLFADTTPATPGGRPWTLSLDSLVLAHGRVTVSRPDSLAALPPRVEARYEGLQLVLGRSFYDLGTKAGEFRLHALAAEIESPPVLLRHAEGRVQLWADSVRLALPAIRLRDTYGSLEGGIGWGDPDAPARLGLLLRADSLAFSDIQWVTDLVPAEGGGRATVRITNGPRRGTTRYAIDSIDARGTGSRVTGRFIADVGDTLAIRDVDVTLAPLDLRFIHEILRDTVPPPPWDGALRGRVRARGGALAAWVLDSSSLEYEDRRLGGTRSRLTVAGTLDLAAAPLALAPLRIALDSVDVRTVGAVTARADSLRGFLRGGVTLAGPVEDFRFDGLDVLLTDPAARVSHLRGAGRMSLDTATTWLEAQLIVDSARVASFGPAITARPLRGTVAGTFSAAARGDSLALELALEGEDAYLRLTGATSTDSARLVFKGDALMETFDARRFLVDSDLPPHRLTARARIALDGNWSGPSGPLEVTIDSTSELAGLELREGRAALVLEPGGMRIDTLAVESTTGRISAKGHLSRDPALRDTVRFTATIDSLEHAAGFLPDTLRATLQDSIGGRLALRGTAIGSLDTVVVALDWSGAGLRVADTYVDTISGDVRLAGVPRAPQGTATVDAEGITLGGVPVSRLASQAELLGHDHLRAAVQVTMGDTLRGAALGEVRLHPDSMRITVDSLRAVTREADWRLLAPASVFSDSTRVVTDTFALRSSDAGTIRFAAAVDTTGPVSGFARIERLPVRHARFTGRVPEGLDGLLTLNASVAGTRTAPTLELTASVDSGLVRDRAQPALALEGRYADRRFALDLRGRSGEREDFALTGTLPVDLRLVPLSREQRLHKDEEIYLRFVAAGYSVVALNGVLPGVSDLEGGIDADLVVGGTWGEYRPRGTFLLRDGAFTVPVIQTRYRDVAMDLALAPDTVLLHRLRLADELAERDTATLEGVIAYVDGAWRADLRSMARSLHVIDNPRLAEADASWQLALRGRLDSLVLSGNVVVPSATAYVADNRDVVLLEEDLIAAEARRRYMPRLAGLTVRLGNEVRLRSSEMNVQLTGEFEVAGSLEAPDVQGEIQATRGSYRLNLGLLQRTFQVDSGVVRLDGVMRPDGTSDNPPRIDIHASYLVRQAEREDVRIGARITGTTREPVVRLASSDLGTAANETEIISYMLFGAPSFALDDRSSSAVRAATAALVPSLGGAVENLLGGQVPWIDDLQVTTVAGEAPTAGFSLNTFQGLLNSFALMAGKQVGPDGYLSLSTGVCRGENRAAQSLPLWFGFTAEYRPRERLSAQFSVSPGSSPCFRVGRFSQIYQFGLDLFRDWRW